MGAQNPIRVLIVDDHAMLRKGLSAFLMSYSDLKLVGEAAHGAEALELCGKLRPDIVLMDLMMPIMGGITATRLIREQYAETQVIVLTSFGEEQLIKDVLDAGAISYLFKKVSAENLAKAIRAAHDGFSTFASEVTEILVRSIQQPHSAFEALTVREREVLALMIKGMRNSEIADELLISAYTAKSHVSSILAKLGADNRIEVITRMLEHSINLGAFYVK